MELIFRQHYLLYVMLGFYLTFSKPVFDRVYQTIKVVIDEKFHIPQAQAYCIGRFDVWDPKITTFPGLYLAVAKFVSPIVPCTTYNLRLFNFVVSSVNMGFFYVILNIVYGHCCGRLSLTMQALNLALLPPLYFFSHVFYTDTFSLLCLLLFTISVIKRYRLMMLFFGICSIGCRQTNVIWAFMFFLQKIIEIIIKSAIAYRLEYMQQRKNSIKNARGSYVSKAPALKRSYDVADAVTALNIHIESLFKSLKLHRQLQSDYKCTLVLLIPNAMFFLFMCYNGSIVVGDKEAHTLTVHFPQLLYFLLFYGFFGLPFVLARFKSTLRFICMNKASVFAITLLSALAVHYNTVVHPYLLADNRHYTFYIWNRWFGKYPEAVYLTLPVYVFLACSFIDNLKDQNCITFLLAYYPCLFLATCFQRLLEIRYFILPYIIARLRFPRSPNWLVACEFLWYLAINAATFMVFFTKKVRWPEFEEAQRIIW